MINISSQNLEHNPLKKSRQKIYNQATFDALTTETEKFSDKMTPMIKEIVEQYGVNLKKLIDFFSPNLHKELFNKPNMTLIDKENMKKSIQYLKDKKMDTSENLKKLDDIKYGITFIEIGGIKFSREKLIPLKWFSIYPDKFGVFSDIQRGSFKTEYNGQQDEYYFTTDAYIEESKKQGNKTIKDEHIRQALQALPGDFNNGIINGKRYHWANILANILNISISGFIYPAAGKALNKFWYLGTASLVFNDCARVFRFDKDGGEMTISKDNFAYPRLSIED